MAKRGSPSLPAGEKSTPKPQARQHWASSAATLTPCLVEIQTSQVPSSFFCSAAAGRKTQKNKLTDLNYVKEEMSAKELLSSPVPWRKKQLNSTQPSKVHAKLTAVRKCQSSRSVQLLPGGGDTLLGQQEKCLLASLYPLNSAT